jgi:[amino group carrier protein]-lysine/ornithine hydrolase
MSPVTETRAVGLLRRMLEIPSPSCHEADLARFLENAMRRMGLRPHIDEVGNAVGEAGRGRGPVVMLLGHLDTIPGVLPVRSEAGRLYGRGAVDAKGPLAAMICAAAELRDFPGRIVVVGAVEEETPGSVGAMAIRATHPQPDLVVIGEPSGWSTVVLGYKGKLDVHYRVTCAPTHPSNPVPKAGELAARCWAVLLEELGSAAGCDSFGQPRPALVSIRGGLTTAELEFSVRTPPGFDDHSLLAALRARVPDGQFTVINSVPACRADRHNPVVRALNVGIRTAGGAPSAKLKTATSDMNTLAEVWGSPMATYGPGDSRLDHSDDEHIALADYLRGIVVLTTALHELASEYE